MCPFIRHDSRIPEGHTLVELLCALGLILLLAGAALPSLGSLAGRWHSRRTAGEVLGLLRQARWLAISEGVEHGIDFPEGDGGWRGVLLRREGAGWRPVGEAAPLEEVTALEVRGAAIKEFNPDGTSAGGSITLSCRDGRRWRFTFTPATGRIRLYREDQ